MCSINKPHVSSLPPQTKTCKARSAPGVTFLRTTPVLAEPVVGRAAVIDGDTLDVRGVRIRLHGVDGPESGQR